MRIEDCTGKRVVVLGYGREGSQAARILAERGRCAQLAVLDESATETPESLPGGVAFHAAGLAPGFLDGFDIVLRSPGINPARPELEGVRAGGKPVSTLTSLWLGEHGPEGVVAVTGTKGKSTTASLLRALLTTKGAPVPLRGNIGVPVFTDGDESADHEHVVLELSSFQLTDLEGAFETLVLTNLEPAHLDWHGAEEVYYRDKMRAVGLCERTVHACSQSGRLRAHLAERERVAWYGSGERVGWNEQGILFDGELLVDRRELNLRGDHNLVNICGALSAALEHGVALEAAREALRAFEPLPHRLEVCLRSGSRLFVNDSIATTPHATVAALTTFADGPVQLIAGGADRGLDLAPILEAVKKREDVQVYAIGPMGERLVREAEARGAAFTWSKTLEEAIHAAREALDEGTILLSPGAPSFDAFRDFEHRGETFRTLARILTEGEAGASA